MFRKKIFALGLAAGALLTLFIIFLVYIFNSAPGEQSLPSLEPLPGSGGGIDISVYDFVVPDEVERFLSPEPVYFRRPRKMWTQEEIREFWLDPRELGIEVLKKENRARLDRFFDGVP